MEIYKVEKDGLVEEIHAKRLEYFLKQGWKQVNHVEEKISKSKLKVSADVKKEDNQDDPWVEPLKDA